MNLTPRFTGIFLPFLTLSLICVHIASFCQDKDEEPIGNGEVMEKIETDTLPKKWRDKRWRLFNGRFSTSKFGAGFLYEYAGYSQDQASRQQMDSIGTPLEPAFAVRDFRLLASGKLKTKRSITWKIGMMYDGVSDSWFVRETGIIVGVPELWGSFFIGRTKEGFSLNKVMNGYSGWTMERQMALDLIPILADGVKWLGYLPKPRILWNAGLFNDVLSEGQSFSTYKWQTALRLAWLPIYSPERKTVFHIGLNYRYGEPKNGAITVRSRPEVNAAPRFIDTGKFQSDYSKSYGGEIYYSKGPWFFGTEIYSHQFSSPTTDNPTFVGGDIAASWTITGESRPYFPTNGIFGFVPVKKPVFKGGPGAWELVVRYSSLDLNGGTIKGGKFWRITPMVNWYLSKEVRLEFVYGYGVLDRFQLQGATQFYQCRLQVTLL
jgi:phosphate-selective porin OprO/OprP